MKTYPKSVFIRFQSISGLEEPPSKKKFLNLETISYCVRSKASAFKNFF